MEGGEGVKQTSKTATAAFVLSVDIGFAPFALMVILSSSHPRPRGGSPAWSLFATPPPSPAPPPGF